MSYKVYVAASSAEIDRAEKVIKALEAGGVEVTSEWIKNIREVGIANEGLTEIQASQAALMNIDSIETAHALLLLVPANGTYSHGAFWEFGYACGLNKTTVIAGQWDRSVFNVRATIFDVDDEKAIEVLCGRAAAGL